LGPFTVVLREEDVLCDRPLTHQEQFHLSSLLFQHDEPSWSDEGKRWNWSVTVSYGGEIFSARFEVEPKGIVMMREDRRWLGNLPTRIWGFWGGVRSDRTLECRAENAA